MPGNAHENRLLGPGPAASHEVDDQGNDREDDEKVDQATRDVYDAPSEQPCHYQDDE
jgi:hypothetical protein